MAAVQKLAWPESGLVSASEDDMLRGWDVETGVLREVSECDPGSARCFAYSPDESLLAFGGEDGLITVENAESGDVVFEVERSYRSGERSGLQPGWVHCSYRRARIGSCACGTCSAALRCGR